MSLSKLWELVMDTEAWYATVHEFSKSQTRLSDWTELDWTDIQWKTNIKKLKWTYMYIFKEVGSKQ